MSIPTRRLGPYEVSCIGLGCMSFSHAYGTPPPPEESAVALNEALDLGYTFFDTAAAYGFGKNETLIGQALSDKRDRFVLASKCGLFRNAEGKREVNGRPEVLKKTCEEALQRLKTDRIDLYYLHRKDPDVPIDDSIGALSELHAEGKILHLGVSEISAETLRKAHAVHPITALQSEYSVWSRNPEIATLETCRELGIAFVAFSPLTRGFLVGRFDNMAELPPADIRQRMPRFEPDNFEANRPLIAGFTVLAKAAGCTPSQLALAWVLDRGEDIIPIPGSCQAAHIRENLGAADLTLDDELRGRIEALVNPATVHGARYDAVTRREIDTEGD